MNREQKEILQSQLNNEEQIIKELKHIFGQAQDDVVNRIIDLSRRRDMENLQTIIYQKQYQEVLKKQIDNILDTLHTNEFSTIEEYLTACYSDGYIGTMYDIAGQGIPLIIPIDTKQVLEAIQTESNLSKKLYDRLGEDVGELKKAVRAELSRGIANGSSWNEIGAQLSKNMKHTPFQKAINNSIRIARTEGHRIQCKATMDAQQKAKSKGANIVKQWDSTLDSRTRKTHRKLDGQIRELDEDFEVDGKKAKAPGYFGKPEEDCNCRCALLQRAKWALDEEELNTLKKRAEFYELDKTEDFEDYKKKYLKAQEKESAYANMSYADKKELIYNNEKQIEKLYSQKKQEEFNMLKGADADEMLKAQEKANEIQKTIDAIKAENKKIQNDLGLPQNAKERFLAQATDISKLPQNIKEDEMGAVGSWTRTDYVFINRYLRFDDKGVRPESIANAEILKQMIDNNIVQESFTVKRGTDYNALNHLFGSDNWKKIDYNVSGKTIQDKGFLATTPLQGGGFGGELQMYIDIPKGAKGVYLGDKSAAPDEKEFLLQAGTRFRVERIEHWQDKWNETHYDIYMEVIVDE